MPLAGAEAAPEVRRRRCPGCGRPLTARGRPATASDQLRPGPSALVECGRCGSALTLGPMPDAVAAHSGGVYAPTGGIAEALIAPLRKLVESDRLRLLKGARGIAGTRVLELGSGDGALLAALADAGASHALGIEPTATSAVPAAGVEVIAAPIEQAEVDARAWELIIFWHSLEHLADPDLALERAASWLAPGGSIVIAVPDRAGLQARLGGNRWFHQDVPRHRSHYTSLGLRLALERAGFEVVRAGHLALDGGPIGMWQTMLNRLTRQPNFAFRLLKRDPSLSFNPRDLGVSLVLGPVLAPIAVAVEIVAGLAGRGGTVVIEARKR